MHRHGDGGAFGPVADPDTDRIRVVHESWVSPRSVLDVVVATGEQIVDETGPTNPLTTYARCKVAVEGELLGTDRGQLQPIIMRNATVPIKDRVTEFTYKISGGRLSAMFDGTEKVLSLDSFHWYNRAIYQP